MDRPMTKLTIAYSKLSKNYTLNQVLFTCRCTEHVAHKGVKKDHIASFGKENSMEGKS